MTQHDRQHVADELDFQVKRIWGLLGDLPPTGGLGWGTLKFEELADVAKRASDALRTSPLQVRLTPNYTRSHEMGWHTGDTGE